MKQIFIQFAVYIIALCGGVFFFEIVTTIIYKMLSIENASDNMFPAAIGSLVGSLLACRYFYKKGVLTLNRSFFSIPSSSYLIPTIVIGISLFYIDEYLAFYLLRIFPSELVVMEASGRMNILLHLFSVLLVAPVFEEIVFRGVFFKTLMSRYKFSVAATITSLLFAIIHFEPVAMPFLFMGAVLYCWVYMKTGSILLPITLHIINNALTAILVYGKIESDLFFSTSTVSQHVWFICAILLLVFCLRQIQYQNKKDNLTENFERIDVV
jgi:Predicted metal-dependent membrane protease